MFTVCEQEVRRSSCSLEPRRNQEPSEALETRSDTKGTSHTSTSRRHCPLQGSPGGQWMGFHLLVADPGSLVPGPWFSCSWVKVPGFWSLVFLFLVLGFCAHVPSVLVHGPWFSCSWFLVSGPWSLVFLSMVPGPWFLVPGFLVSGSWLLVPGFLVPGFWCC